MKEKMNQMFQDKLFLVMLVLGLLTMVAAAGVVTIRRGNGQEQKPYVDMQGQDEYFAEEAKDQAPVAENSNAENSGSEITQEEQILAEAASNQDNAADEQGHIAEEAGPETANGQNTGLAANGTKDDGADPAVREAGAGGSAATALVLNFADTSKMLWPARGNVLLDYSMDSTIYFPTLEQYKCNPGLVIQSEVSTPVYAPADARVLEAGNNEEIGDYLVLDLGNDYTVTCGQLKEITAVQGEYLEAGQLLGYVAEPTKYYTIEGSNLFLEMRHGDKTVDPLDYLE